MKNLYAIVVACLFVGSAFAQQALQTVPKSSYEPVVATAAQKVVGSPIQAMSAGAPAAPTATTQTYWSDDFSIPGNWSVGHTAGTQGDWVIGTAPLAFVGAVQSTSGGNFAGFDSDVLGQGTTNDAWIRTATSINLSGTTNLRLNWQQSYQRFQDVVAVEYSTDGVNYTAILVNPDIGVNQSTPNPDYRSIDISVVAGQPAVWIGFRYTGAWDYAWAVDDVEIVDPPGTEMGLSQFFFNTHLDPSSSIYYSEIPKQHAYLDTMFFGAAIENNGITAQNNVKLTVDISGADTWSVTSPAGVTYAVGQADSLDLPLTAPNWYIPANEGLHSIDFRVTSDSSGSDTNPFNDVRGQDFNVGTTVYARDFDDYSGGISYAAGTDVHQMAVSFEIRTNETVNSMSIFFFNNGNAGTTDGAVMNFHIYDANFAPIASENFVTVDATWFSTWVDVPFTTPVNLTPGFYLVGYETLNTTDEAWIGVGSFPSNPPEQVSFVSVGGGAWGWIDRLPMIRMNVEEFLDPCASTLNADVESVSCNGANDGEITMNIAGGTAPFTYAWSNGATTETISNLMPGTYTVTVTDDLACVDSVSFTIMEPTVLAIGNISSTGEVCGGGDGTATSNVSGGTAPYTYAWSNGQTTATATGLSQGSTSVSVTDQNGCTATQSVMIGGSVAVTATDTVTNAACGVNDGEATATPGTGVSPFTYAWDDGGSQTTATATGLGAGLYTVTITDNLGCTLEMPVALSNIGAATLTAVASDADCNGASTGSIDVTATGGTAPFTYAWTNGGGINEDATALPAGWYVLQVTDSAGCLSFVSATVAEPTAIALSGTDVDVTCNGDTDGSIDLTAAGGTPGYTYLWDDNGGSTTQDLSGLGAGTYSVTVTDSQNCPETMSFTVGEPAVLSTALTPIHVNCFGDATGNIGNNPTGGTTPYTYAWNNGPTTANNPGLIAGTYDVDITDANGCTTNAMTTITQPASAISTTIGAIVAPTAMGANDGSATVSATGGTGNLNYLWSNGATTATATGLGSGNYSVTVTDDNGCTSVTTGISVPVGINDNYDRKLAFRVYPNPNNGTFNVAFGSLASDKANLVITDLIGSVIYAESLTLNGNTTKQIDLTSFSQGVYFLNIEADGRKSTQKIVIR